MATKMVPPRTPSPKVRIRAQSFDSPSSRMSTTPIDESPYSKSTGSIIVRPYLKHNVLRAAETGKLNGLLPLHTKMSDESFTSTTSSASSSPTSDEDSALDLCVDSPVPSPTSIHSRERPHPITFSQTPQTTTESPSPFLYQDLAYPMYSPWLVRAVLDLYDIRGLDWMSIANPVEQIWGVRTTSAEVLDILSANGRVAGRKWWD